MPTLTCHEIDDQLDGYLDAVCEHERRVATAIARVERDEGLKQHLDTLGMPDAEAYRQWCRRHGLSTRLAKSPLARADELDQMRLMESWRFSSRQHHRLMRLRRFARRGAWDQPRRATEQLIVDAVDEVVGSDADARERFCRLVTALGVENETFRVGQGVPIEIVNGLARLAAMCVAFVRDPEDWHASSSKIDVAFRSLARHVSVRYEMPRWLLRVWEEPQYFNPAQFRVAVHVGQGYHLASADLPFPMTRRAAHRALEAPASFGFFAALRFGQARAFGASRAWAKEIATCGLQWEQNDALFWNRVVQWLANHDDFPADELQCLVDYIDEVRSQKRWVCDPRGRWIQRAAAPEWDIGGRTTASLLREMRSLARTSSDESRKKQLPRARPEQVRLKGDRTEWLLVPVTTEEQFLDEGTSMRHCVATYHEQAEEGQLAIWSLRKVEGCSLARRVTICVRPNIGIAEARGMCNRNPTRRELDVIALWAQRRRLPMTMLEV